MSQMQGPVVPAQPQAVAPFQPLQLGLSAESKLALVDYWRSITKRKWAILGLGAVMAVLAGAVAFSITPVYRSTATVLIEQGRGKVLSIDDLYSGGTQSREHYQTQVEIIKSREVAVRTAKQLKLWEWPDFDPRKPDESLRTRLKAMVGIRPEAQQWTDEALADASAKRLIGSTSVEPVRLSQLVRVNFESTDAKQAAQLANKLATSYIDADRESRFKLTQDLNTWLEQRAGELSKKLAESEAALQTYRDKNGLVNLSGSAQVVAGKELTEVADQLAQARGRRMQLESAYFTISSIHDGNYRSVPAVVGSASVQAALAKEADAAAKVDQLTSTLGSGHPSLVDANTQLSNAKAFTKANMLAVVQSVTQEYNQALRAERSLASTLAQASGSVQDVNRKESQLTVLEREVNSNRELYSVFMNRAKELDAGGDIKNAVARVVDAAVPNTTPVKPQKVQIIVVALVLGLFLGAMGSLLLDRLDNTIKGGESAEAKLHQPVITVLPKLDIEAESKAAARLFLSDPMSHHAEAIRTARTGVLLSNVDEAHRVLLVTSSLPTEGKTTFSANLALALSQTKRTLLIDADMRRPQLGSRLGLQSGAKGLSDLVTGTATLKECVHAVEGSNLLVIPAGKTPLNPTELLLSQRFKDVVRHLQPQVDFILIDSPPVELVSDALAIAPLASGTIYVVKAMQTPHPVARKGIARLERAGAKILGLVVNGLDFEKAERYYGESVLGGYGYGYTGYYNNAPEEKGQGQVPATSTAQSAAQA